MTEVQAQIVNMGIRSVWDYLASDAYELCGGEPSAVDKVELVLDAMRLETLGPQLLRRSPGGPSKEEYLAAVEAFRELHMDEQDNIAAEALGVRLK